MKGEAGQPQSLKSQRCGSWVNQGSVEPMTYFLDSLIGIDPCAFKAQLTKVVRKIVSSPIQLIAIIF